MATATQKVALSTVVQIIGRFVQLSLGLISFKVLTSYLGVDGYGEYSIIFNFSSLAAIFADFGTTTLIIRELSQKKAALGSLIGSGFVVNCLVGLITAAVFSGLLVFFPYTPSVKIGILLALLGVFIGNLNIYGSYFSYKIRLDLFVLIETLGRLLNIILLVWLVSVHASFLWIVAATPFSLIFNAVLGTILVLKDRINPRINWQLVRHIFWHSIPIGVVMVLGVAQYRVDSVILSILKPSADVAIYSAAGKIVDLLVIIPTFFMSAIYPVLSAAYHSSGRFRVKTKLAFDFILMISLPTLAGAFLLAPQIITFVGTKAFVAAAVPLQILTFSVLLSCLTLYHNSIALVAGLQKKMVPRAAIALAVNVIANLILIPMFSYDGAAIAAVISNAVGLTLIVDLLSRHVAVERSMRRLPRVIAAVALMSAGVYFIRSVNVVAIVLIAAAVYLAGLVISRAISVNEMRTLLPESLLKKLRLLPKT